MTDARNERMEPNPKGVPIAYWVLLSALIVTTAAYTFFSWSRESARHQQQQRAFVGLAAQGVDTYFKTLEKAIAGLGRELRNDGLGAGTIKELKDFKAQFPEFSIVLVIGLDGKILYSSEDSPGGEKAERTLKDDPSFKEFFQRAPSIRGLDISRSLKGPITNLWITPMRYVVRDDEDTPVFFVSGGLAQARAHAFWKDVPLPPGAGMGLLRDDLFLVARFPPIPNGTGEEFGRPNAIAAAEVLQARGFPRDGSFSAFGKVTQSSLQGSFQRLANFPLTLSLVEPADNLTRDWLYSAVPIYVALVTLFAGGLYTLRWQGRHQASLVAERTRRITELETANLRQEALNAELEAFVYTVSHDLRAPIRAINGFTSMLEEEVQTGQGSRAADLVQNIKQNSIRMSALLNDLLDLSRYSIVDVHRDRLDMNAQVGLVLQELGLTGGGVNIVVDDLPSANGDPSFIRQVWSNLISNAVKYSSRSASPEIHVGFAHGQYFVSDNGVGFDMAYSSKLFKLFSRLHGNDDFDGTGIGLAIVKRIVERHGGAVTVQSSVGVGSTFSFSLGSSSVDS